MLLLYTNDIFILYFERKAAINLKRRRCLFDNSVIPNIREVCSVSFDKTSEPLEVHIHPQAMEICFVERGRQSYSVNGEIFDVNGGGIFLTYPNEEHLGGSMFQERGMLYYLILDTVNNRENFLGMGGEAEFLAESLQNISPRAFCGSEKLKGMFEKIFSIFDDKENALRTPLLKCAVFELLYEICQCSRLSPSNLSPDIAAASEYIDSHITQKIPLSVLAEISGLSLAGFKRKFREQTGISPADCIMRRRIEYSKQLLLGGKTVTQTAFELDFSSSQHFSTAFGKCCGISPTQFLRSQKNE